MTFDRYIEELDRKRTRRLHDAYVHFAVVGNKLALLSIVMTFISLAATLALLQGQQTANSISRDAYISANRPGIDLERISLHGDLRFDEQNNALFSLDLQIRKRGHSPAVVILLPGTLEPHNADSASPLAQQTSPI